MKISIRLNLLILVLILGSETAIAQLAITGEIRPRAEYRDGFKTLSQDGSEAAFFVEQRTRLGISFEQERLLLKISLQDVRFWGGTSQIYKTDNALFNVNEAWAGLRLGETGLIKVGRQQLDYDNARILGDLRWAQQSRSHDLVKFEHTTEYGFSLHLGAAFNQEFVASNAEPARLFSTFYSGVNNYKTMQYAWMNKKYDAGSFSFLLLNTGFQATDTTQKFLQTAGYFWKQKLGDTWSLTSDAYYQLGKNAADQDVSAYMASLTLSTKLGKHQLAIGADHLSGTEPGSSDVGAFAPLFGTNHKFYGFMDYFYVGNGHGNAGLTDGFLKANFKVGEKSNLLAHAHYFLSAIELEDGEGNALDSNLGTEIDLVFNSQIDDKVNLKIGFSALNPTESMGALKTGDTDKMTFWGWTMITIKPTLFKSE